MLLRKVVCAFTLLAATSAVMGQVATGNYTFGTFDNKGIDTINVGNLNVDLSIPVLNKAGRGMPFYYNLRYDSSVWSPATVSGATVWTPTQAFGWHGDTEVETGYVSYSTEYFTFTDPDGEDFTETIHDNFTYHDPFGVQHWFETSTVNMYCWGTLQPAYCTEQYPSFTESAIDGSGYTLTVSNYTTSAITGATGKQFAVSSTSSGAATDTDSNGNQISVNSSGQFTDTLGDVVLSVSGNAPNPVTFMYTNPKGTSSNYKMNYELYTVKTDFGVSGVTEYGPLSNSLVSSITLPDGSSYSFTYEETPGSCTPVSGTYSSNCVTGRIASVTLPTGGTINYSYSGGNNGIESDGSTAGLTRTLSTGGSWKYSRALVSGTPGPGSTWTTTVVDPSNNNTLVNFTEDRNATPPTYNFYETQRKAYQGSASSGSLLSSSVHCYNGNYQSCSTATVSSPITKTDAYAQLPSGLTRLSETTYNTYGLVTDYKEYGYGVVLNAAPSSTYLVRETAISYDPPSNGIATMVKSKTIMDWSSGSAVTLASSSYAYDGATVTATSGTPQHIAISGARGNVTQVTTSTSSTASLTASYTYYDTGNLNVATAVNGAQTTYIYGSGSCGNSFATSVNGPLGLSNSAVWNCTGGVTTSATDPNKNSVTTNYADPEFWRPTSIVDQLSNDSTISFSGHAAVETSLANFNNGKSVLDSRTTVDGFGRTVFSQLLQGPNATTYDTKEVDYNNLGQPYRTTMAYSAAASPSSSNTTAPATITTYDALGRVLTRTDATGGKVTYTYTNNDILQAVTGTQSFKKQFEYDGLGRLMSVCEISTTLAGVGKCGQSTSQTGYWTKYSYDALGHLLTVTQNAQAATTNQQTRTYTYDWLGRMTSEKNPETGNNGTQGTIVYTYDSVSSCGGSSYTYFGNLVQRKDNGGNVTCYAYDALNRPTKAGNSSIANTTLREFVYDSETSYPTGVSIANGMTHMVEAKTINTSSPTVTVTDEFFSYSARGELTDAYESTPHSGGFFHTTAAYWATGALKTLSGIPGVPVLNYGASGAGLDGEGRYTQVTAASGTNPITNVTYSTSSTTNYLGALTGVTFGSGDGDSFTYDPNSGRMKSYNFSVNSQNDTGTLSWNSNGTLGGMVINDQITGTSDSQTCTYGYDDLRRVSSVNCGTLWGQNFTYDAFGNISKSVPSGSSGGSFLPGYYTTPPTNQFLSLPGITPKYDANGNLLTDNLNTYTWDPNWGKMLTVSTGSTTVTVLYDAMGRMVENNAGGSYQAFVYGPTGSKLAITNGRTLVKAFIALPGGVKAIYNSTGLAYYRHSDWLGSSRLTSTASRTLYSSTAYSPFGEQYSKTGVADASFTGQDQDTVPSLYDFPARRYSPSQGRWISPDPLGIGAVTMSKPQSWNRYAYALNNPLTLIDSMGLSVRRAHSMDLMDGDDDDDDDDGGGGGGGGGGDDDDDDDSGTPPPPVNNNDCLFISAGINTSPDNSGGIALDDFANNYPGDNTDVAMPYGPGKISGALSVFSQALFGPNQATNNFAASLAAVTASNSNVTLVLFSGSAEAFNTALSNGMISQSELNSISQIIYLSPGSPGGFGNPQSEDDSGNYSPIPTATYVGQGLVDGLVTGSNINGMPDATTIDGCGHSVTCELGATDSTDGNPVIGELPAQSDCADTDVLDPEVND